MKQLTKSHYEFIAQAFVDESRSSKAVLEMARSLSLHTGKKHPNEERMLVKLDTLWGLALHLATRMEATLPNFNREKFLEATKCSPQEWRFHKFIDGKYVKDEEAAWPKIKN